MFTLNYDKKRLIDAALGNIPNALAFHNARILNVFTKQFLNANVYCIDGFISHVEYDLKKTPLKADKVIDVKGRYLLPGFIDAHVHIESSFLTPQNYAKLVIFHGTTTIIEDCHEIANVLGKEGIQYMLDAGKRSMIRQLMSVPSCVPSVPGLENSGAQLLYEDYFDLYEHEQVIGLGEVMDYQGVLRKEERILDIILTAQEKKAYLQGHAPLLRGNELSAYLVAGIQSDHESKNAHEVLEKYRQGMWIDIRDANTNRNMEEIISGLAGNYERVSFCSDDRRCDVIRKEGHMDGIVKDARKAGMPLIDALLCASWHPAQEMGLQHMGAIAPSYVADLLICSDIESLVIDDVFIEGHPIVHNKEILFQTLEEQETAYVNIMNPPKLTLNDFSITCREDCDTIEMNIISYESFTSSITNCRKEQFHVKHGRVVFDGKADMMFAMVVNRYGKGTHAMAIIERFGIDHGALASSVSHDAHNICIVFDTPENGWKAYTQLMSQNGGMCAVEKGNVLATLPLPIAGLMSNHEEDDLIEELSKLSEANRCLGNHHIPYPVSRITILSLLVCPFIKLSDIGMVSTEKKKIIPIFAKE